MKKIKYIIIFLGLIAIVLLLILLGYRKLPKGNDDIVDVRNIEVPNSLHSIGYKDFFTVSNCISQYLDILNKNNSSYYGVDENGKYSLVVTSKQVAENILGLMSDNYKKELDINESNISSKIKMLNEKNILILTKVSKIKEGKVYSYVAQGFTVNMDDKFLRDVDFIVNLDIVNHTYSIEELSAEDDLDNITREAIDKIEKNIYNSYTEYKVNEEDTINRHLTAYKRMMLSNPKLAYEYLDEDYRNKRFGSYKKFNEYINEFKSEITALTMKKYKINSYDDYKEYVIIDANGNYYRFRENNVMDYTVMLDVYTIDLPEFLEQYNSAKDEQKVSLNIEKFIQMINAKDYESAYNLLDDTYKANNFKTLDEFEKYIQDNFHNYNTIDSTGNVSKEGKYYICTAYLRNTKFMDNEPIERSFVISLGEGTDFKMSINLDY